MDLELDWPITLEEYTRWVDLTNAGHVAQIGPHAFEFRSNTRTDVWEYCLASKAEGTLSEHGKFMARAEFTHASDAVLFKLKWC